MIKTRSKEEWIKIGNEIATNRKRRIETAKKWKFDTIATHGLYDMKESLRNNNGSLIEPVYMSPAQTFSDANEMEAALAYEMPAWIYSRFANPSVNFLSDTMSLLEGYGSEYDTSSLVTGSGMSAIFLAVETLLVKDDSLPPPNIVSQAKIYGGTFHLFTERLMEDRGIEVKWVSDALDMDEWKSLIDDGTRFLYGEFPSNPAVEIFDIEKVADLAHENNIPLIVDATCASPAITRPIQFGADIVVQSASKVISASGTTIIGTMTSRRNIPSRAGADEMKEDFARWCQFIPNRDFGPAIHPMGAILTLNDLRTLRMRAERMSRSAATIAQYLESHPKVDKVFYPGLKSNEHHNLAKKYMKLADSEENLFGFMMSFNIAEGKKFSSVNTRKFYDALELIWRTADLGRVKTICTLPTISTHQQQGEEGRELADILPSCVRLSIGVEDVDDLLADLDQALKKI